MQTTYRKRRESLALSIVDGKMVIPNSGGKGGEDPSLWHMFDKGQQSKHNVRLSGRNAIYYTIPTSPVKLLRSFIYMLHRLEFPR